MPALIRLFPHHRHYVSLFGGSAADILRKPRSKLETFNDLDHHIYGLFRVIQDPAMLEKLRGRVMRTPDRCEHQYLEAQRLLAEGEHDPIVAAWAFLIVATQGVASSSATRQTSGDWVLLRKTHGQPEAWRRLQWTLDWIAQRFRGVVVCSKPWHEMLEKADSPETFVFADPPYHPTVAKKKMYAHGLTAEEHDEFLTAMNKIRGKAMICGYPHESYERALKGWVRYDYDATTSSDVNSKIRRRRERVWLNYDPREES